ncbi:MAG: SDR family oxidoreductase, partial [Candidatus Rokuibacteriota bacterium]
AVGVAPDGRRLEVVEADVSRLGSRLAASPWRRLAREVETVIHCAGETTFFPEAMAAFRAGHVDGPLCLLGELGRGRLRRWVQLSTAYVCGRRSGPVFEHDGDVGQRFHNPYEAVKLGAETALRGAGAEMGVDVRVVRPSIVVGPAPETAGGSPSNLFFAFIRLVVALAERANGAPVPLRIVAAPAARLNIVPVEYVAAAVVALADHPEGARATVHAVVSDAPTQETMLGMIGGRVGLRGVSLVDARSGPLPHPSALERRITRMLAAYREYLEQDVSFDDATAERLLTPWGVPRPTLSPEAVHRLIDQALVGCVSPGTAGRAEEPGPFEIRISAGVGRV